MNDTRRFDDEAAGEVLRRAAELQHESSVPAHSGGALSAADLEQVAREAGIDPAYVRRAMAEREVDSPETRRSPIFGEVKTLELVEVLEGEVSQDSLDRMLEEIQRSFADGGDIIRTGRSATWTASRGLSSSRLSHPVVSITPRDGQTEIRISERLDSLSSALFVGLGVAGSAVGVGISGAIGMGEFGSPVAFVLMAATAVSACYGTARTLYTRSTRRRRRELQRLLGKMVAVSISGSKMDAVEDAAELPPADEP
jgi:hypothetical protein